MILFFNDLHDLCQLTFTMSVFTFIILFLLLIPSLFLFSILLFSFDFFPLHIIFIFIFLIFFLIFVNSADFMEDHYLTEKRKSGSDTMDFDMFESTYKTMVKGPVRLFQVSNVLQLFLS